jgi:type I restriction enzyme S subunit
LWWPPLEEDEQHAIAYILGTLDDKIELNRRMNETLEAMARALFKSWFVDFDPVRAKAGGRDPGLPKPLADLFPSRLVDSDLGEIPEGWVVGTVGQDLRALVSGARPRGGAVDEGVPSVGAENVIGLGRYDFSKEKFVPLEFFEQLKAKGADVRPSDVLLYKDGAQIGRKTFFDRGFPHAECVINEHVFILRCASSRLQRYLFFWLDLPWMTGEYCKPELELSSAGHQPGGRPPATAAAAHG